MQANEVRADRQGRLIPRPDWWPWLIVFITCIGAFIGQLDASIVQLALPTMVGALHTSLDRVTWVALAYTLAFAAFLPISARLSEAYGRKKLYLSGCLLFTAATVLCGLAPNLGWLVAFRFAQGMGARPPCSAASRRSWC